MSPEKFFSLTVRLEDTGEIFQMHKCHDDMTIGDMKSTLELVAGIPTNLQRLFYMDEGEMPDNVTLQFNGIIKDAIITMKTWFQDGWMKLLRAAAHGDNEELASLGVRKDSNYSTPNSRRMSHDQRAAWIAERASTALFIAAHRGHINTVKFLLKNGANPRTKTVDGHTALHMAVIMAKADCINDLLLHGAEAEGTDSKGRTLLDLARMTEQRENIGKIFNYQWTQRTAGLRLRSHIDESELYAHQRFDSTLKTWRSGPHAKLYMANLLQSGKRQGTRTGKQRNPAPAPAPAGENHPAGAAKRVSAKRSHKPNPGPGQAGKPPAQPQDVWREEAAGVAAAHRSSDGAHWPGVSFSPAKSVPQGAADRHRVDPTRSGESSRHGIGKPRAAQEK
ncbi:ankyrin repeat domain-containing protein 60-like [Heptranchias perlo]|uniref:ankyrin repeat domain-containing protein 60-like n=1 Tax=Heptranchias perlo TaxID=212740 RepID=UPI00355A674B